MTSRGFENFPFIPDFSNLGFDTGVAFVVSALLAILVNAEAQGWMATLLGDYDPEYKDRFHFNVFFHLSVLGSLCYLVAGFGWPKPVRINPANFKYPRLYTILVRFTGMFANFMLANIAASLVFVIRFIDFDPLVFLMVAGVNLATAVYHLIPLPPLAAGSLITVWLPDYSPRQRRAVYYSGSLIILAILGAERITGVGIFRPYLDPLVRALLRFLVA